MTSRSELSNMPGLTGPNDDNETVVGTIYRHPIGLIALYILVIGGLLGALLLLAILLPGLGVHFDAKQKSLIGLLIVSIGVFAVVFLAIATAVYRQSRLIVTTENVTQILQQGLLVRNTSQLSLANIEDVTSEQKGLFANIFKYGTLKIETAGEQEHFFFPYCPYPSAVAKQVIEAREEFIEGNRDKMEKINPHLAENLK